MVTNYELWGKAFGNNLLLPGDIGRIVCKLPPAAGLTPERFILENTVFPLFRPFVSRERARLITDAMAVRPGNGKSNAVAIAGLPWVKHQRNPYLRYCEKCIEADLEKYGEAYWHRLHQLPGIYCCEKHHCAVTDTDIRIDSLSHEYLMPPAFSKENPTPVALPLSDKHIGFSEDAAWLLQFGDSLGYYEETVQMYDKWLRAKGFRKPGETQHKRLAAAIAAFYGEGYLSGLDAYNSGTCQWARYILHYPNKINHPMYHLLLIRFLAGSAENFFYGSCEVPEERQPFGAPPYPCRNAVCEHHLTDVIEQINIANSRGRISARFVCPHCGFAYQRKGPVQKAMLYSDRPFTIEYGPIWHGKLAELLNAGNSVSNVASILHCAVHTVRVIAVKAGLLPEDCIVVRKSYPKKRVPSAIPLSLAEKRDAYRQRWTGLLAEHPGAARSELMFLDEKCHLWLKTNDAIWYEENTPAARNNTPTWADNDTGFAESLELAAKELRDVPGRPIWINVTSLADKAGIVRLHGKVGTGRLPQTRSALNELTETADQWRQRKIVWAIGILQEQGIAPTTRKVLLAAAVSDKDALRFKDFITEQISVY